MAVTIYKDWFLPSQNELVALWDNLISQDIGNFFSDWYWSSTELDGDNAVFLDAEVELSSSSSTGEDRINATSKASICSVRPIRIFISTEVYSIGDKGPDEGWIFYINYINPSVPVYYECASMDLGFGTIWSNVLEEIEYDSTQPVTDAKGIEIGDGLSNTNAIIAQHGFKEGAAKLCKDYSIEISSIPTTYTLRVTPEEVKEILDDSSLSDNTIYSYILSANTLINSALGKGLTDLLKEIERWLTAHMISITRERMAKKEEAGGAKIEYTGIYGQGLFSTSYGQMVLALDSTGKLASLMGRSAKITAIKSFNK